MKVSYNWLKEYVDVDLAPNELADMLTMLGLEVEGLETRGGGMDDVVVARIEERQQHPNADKLSLCKVNNGKETLNIVCGAQNMKAGDTVALAQIGAVLPGDFKIKRSKIRGEESWGMLCSEKELGLAEESEGIMILPPGLSLGTPVFSALGIKDTIFEVSLTPNRADCLSIIGIAREISAKLGKKIKHPAIDIVEGEKSARDLASITIEDSDKCPRYAARIITGCKVAPSPQWLVNKLAAAGMRSINNVVDITNYLLMEYGHPLHAFDFDLLKGAKIVVRRAAEGERFTTLDGQERTLTTADLTIRDGERAVALAGVMGGGNSEISDTTVNILLESAYFDPISIRRTAKRLGLHTESSHRFERGADINLVVKALDRAASLIAALAGGTVAKGVIDVYPKKADEKKISFRVQRANELLGLNLSAQEMKNILSSLELVPESQEPGILQVTVPTFRVDIEREIDLVEEIARVHGYGQIPATMPQARVFSDRPSPQQKMEMMLKDLLVAQGFNEIITYSFIHPDSFDKILLPSGDARRNTIGVLNPLSEDQSVMRTIMLPGLVETAARNVNFRQATLRLFEMRRVYLPVEGRELPDEIPVLAGIMSGSRDAEGWNQIKDSVDFYDIKGTVENILDACRAGGVAWKTDGLEPFCHPGKSCTIWSGNNRVGSLGELHPSVQENYGLGVPIYYFELNLDRLMASSRDMGAVVAPSRFPDITRDIALLLDDEITADSVIAEIKALKLKEVQEITIFDLYKGPNLPAGQKSIALRLRYISPERTLTDDEVNALHQRVIDHFSRKSNISVR